MPRSWRAGRGVGAGRRPRPAPQHRGDAGHQSLFDLLRADEMDMRIDAARGDDLALACDRLGSWPDDDADVWLDVRIAGFADPGDAAILDADVGLDDAPVIDDQ